MLRAGNYFLSLSAVTDLDYVCAAALLKNFSCAAMEAAKWHAALGIGRNLYCDGLAWLDFLNKSVYSELCRAAELLAGPPPCAVGLYDHENTDCYL